MRIVNPGEGDIITEPEREEWEQEVYDVVPTPPRKRGKGQGRPSKRTPERAVVIIAALREGSTREGAGAVAGISARRLNEWYRDNEDFLELVEKAERFAQADMLKGIRRAGRDQWQALAWLLERRWPEQFAKREKTDVVIEVRSYVQQLAEKHGVDESEVMARLAAVAASRQG